MSTKITINREDIDNMTNFTYFDCIINNNGDFKRSQKETDQCINEVEQPEELYGTASANKWKSLVWEHASLLCWHMDVNQHDNKFTLKTPAVWN